MATNYSGKTRIESDLLGEMAVPVEALYGVQTLRGIENFPISRFHLSDYPLFINGLAMTKLAAAQANHQLGLLTDEQFDGISKACLEILEGKHHDQFPCDMIQGGAGTTTNMNANEVIANRGNEILGKSLLHPNDDVNMSQSSNDTFPTAMHVSAVVAVKTRLIPAVELLIAELLCLEEKNKGIVKSGRTHLQDATPIAFSQEISGWRASLERDLEMIENALIPLKHLAIGATAVGTGLNAPKGFDRLVCEEISKITGFEFLPEENKFHALSSKGELVAAHGAIKALACDLMKIANDIRWLASGPRCGLGEITIPENEPGSSIMPGKVNPTQCEAMTMVCVQVMANDYAVSMSASQGNFELNVFMPVCIHNLLQSVRLLADACISFNNNCVCGIQAKREKMHANLHNSLMLATALNPYIGYENAARVVHLAHEKDISLKEACIELGYLDEEKFDEYFHPEKMI